MKIKQESTTCSSSGKDLEDLLLKTQDGLVLLRELPNRRDQQWKEVGEQYGYQRQDNKVDAFESVSQSTKHPTWLQTLVSKLSLLNVQVATTAHCAVKRSESILSPSLLRLRALALESYHRLEHGQDRFSANAIDFVHVQDVNLLLQFNYLKHQQSVAMERFFIRLKWLPVSHRFHLRQRMLALTHQQKMKNTPRPNVSTAYRNSEDHLHCPLFVMFTSHFVAELKALAQHFPPDDVINTDRRLEMNLETLVHTYTGSSRWDLIQRGYLGNCEPIPGPIEHTLTALRNAHKLDSLLTNEWELLTLDDSDYLRVRLEALSKAHRTRAKVDVATATGCISWNPDALYSLYALRVSSCRAKRLSLLRLLNYLHFIQFSHTKNDTDDEENDNSGDGEFIFAAARRDLEMLELQMLRIASIFIFKQEYDSLPTSPWKRNNDKNYSERIVTPIDRLQVLRDVYDCEVAFLQTKVQLVEILLENGLQSAPRTQDFAELNFVHEANADSFGDILLPILQRRPYLDFSHAYFFESYATETILLELQTSLIQQMEQHFKRLEWCNLHDVSAEDNCEIDNSQRQWICQQILGRRALVKLYIQYNEVVRDADDKWFSATSVGEFQALQHALLESTLVMWSLIIKLELPGRPVRCLERTAGDLLVGCGWQLILYPQLLSDVCRTLHEQPNGSSTLVESLTKAIELENWRQTLAKNVYEANLLERIHNFQFDFVKHVSTWDSLIGDQARHFAFFFDVGECDRAGFLKPLAIELEKLKLPATNVPSPHRSDDSKSISERSLLQLQRRYVAYLRVSVKYHDAVGADVFEFAASYPYVCLANSFTPTTSDESSTISMDLNTVRTKYAKEIADKMTEELRTSCFPYWKRLESLKQQLLEQKAHATTECRHAC
ncbi:uncharacterized protein PITG_19239 [Phytophthora infestans T30-4]|uniref:Uncharacterized protein n=1 Tax=Phytophthora infestans (strain T30-4) TaxID=403677 RepID=D0NZS8_PHYIT|nr:uncharacterized protein PITG_19239 [Phytophthora infestans T30-4]EEY69643.1 conserved hypothetical protein [Phytophthora infestans T30-4]|eukprot:XP_002997142.1 conserved hypothetical protein [Phytophthora infestans T30-4]